MIHVDKTEYLQKRYIKPEMRIVIMFLLKIILTKINVTTLQNHVKNNYYYRVDKLQAIYVKVLSQWYFHFKRLLRTIFQLITKRMQLIRAILQGVQHGLQLR